MERLLALGCYELGQTILPRSRSPVLWSILGKESHPIRLGLSEMPLHAHVEAARLAEISAVLGDQAQEILRKGKEDQCPIFEVKHARRGV